MALCSFHRQKPQMTKLQTHYIRNIPANTQSTNILLSVTEISVSSVFATVISLYANITNWNIPHP